MPVIAATDSTGFAVLLLMIGVAGVLVELTHPGVSVPGIVGAIALVAGALYLFEVDLPDVEVAPELVVAIGIVLAVLCTLAFRASIHARRTPVTTGTASLVGTEGRVTQALSPNGMVRVRGEVWSARLAHPGGAGVPTSLGEGTAVSVVAVHGLVLEVEPVASSRREVEGPETGGPELGEARS